MFALALFCMLGVASAAPHYYHHHHGHSHRPYARLDMDDNLFGDDVFDTARFWQQLQTEMEELEKVLSTFHTRFSVASASAGVEGNEYKVKMNLPGFDEKDIVVKAREGVLMVQAVHKGKDGISESNYVDMRTLPSNVDTAGVWGYSDHVLTITFPLKGSSTEAAVSTEVIATQAPDISREELDVRSFDDNVDADVGVKSEGDKEVEIKTNEIPKQAVEATTYAVDLKDQYEFVPVHYRK